MKTILLLLFCCITMHAQGEVEFLKKQLPIYTYHTCQVMLAPWGASKSDVMRSAKKAGMKFVSDEHTEGNTVLTYRKNKLVVCFTVDDNEGYWMTLATVRAPDEERAQILTNIGRQFMRVAYAGVPFISGMSQACNDSIIYASSVADNIYAVYTVYRVKQ